MAKRRHRTPNRTATRADGGLRLVRDDSPSVTGQESLPTFVHDEADDPEAELVAGVAVSMLDGLASARHRLAAELVLASMFGILGSGLPEELDEGERAAASAVLLTGLIRHCEQLPSSSALGFLRLAAEQGPAPCRAQASAAAQRLADRGIEDPRWVSAAGSLSVLRAWRYGDVFGAQSSVGILFAYGHREHALCVLIDHELGGGIKDAWFAEGRDARGIRDRVARSMADEPAALFEDISEGQALDVLRSALACEPCPVAPDQVEDVDRHLHLVHARAQQLARLQGEPPVELRADTILSQDPGEAERASEAPEVFRLKVTLAWSRPPIWRRLEVPAGVSLARLHAILQVAFGWTDSHLHAFEVTTGGGRPLLLEGAPLRRTKLSSLLGVSRDRLDYVYDFGDGWRHTIVVEERLSAQEGTSYPRCTGGRRAAPPEDSGGVPGYEQLLQVLADPDHPEHEQMAEWAGPLDPVRFDRAAVNAGLKSLSKRT